jgi:hypothetical protein
MLEAYNASPSRMVNRIIADTTRLSQGKTSPMHITIKPHPRTRPMLGETEPAGVIEDHRHHR